MQFRKVRSSAHIKDVEHAFIVFTEAIKENRLDWEGITINDLNDEVIGYIYEHLEQRNYSARTKNKYYSYGKSFLKWWQDEYYPIRNWFSRITRHEEVHNPQSMPLNEFDDLLEILSPEGGVKEYQSKSKPTRNYYKPYLKSAFKLGLLTGLRREELINLKWGNIQYDKEEQPIYIKVEDYKSNRIRKRELNKKYKYVPISSELQKLLVEMSRSIETQNDEFILAPEIRQSRTKSMADNLSRGFSHFYEQLNTGRSLTFKSLRKSYITALKQYTFNPKEISGHSGNQVLERHYIDREKVAISMRNFNLFPTIAGTRNDELSSIRKDSNKNQKDLEK
ncbi:MAG: site-specific integrase [Bacteroidia bacterium]|nr:site-specific integrase [Bacteroidia bacterium]